MSFSPRGLFSLMSFAAARSSKVMSRVPQKRRGKRAWEMDEAARGAAVARYGVVADGPGDLRLEKASYSCKWGEAGGESGDGGKDSGVGVRDVHIVLELRLKTQLAYYPMQGNSAARAAHPQCADG